MSLFERIFEISGAAWCTDQRLKNNLYHQDYSLANAIEFKRHLLNHTKPFVYRSILFSTCSSLLIVSTALVGKMIIETNQRAGLSGLHLILILSFLVSFILLLTYLSIKNRNNLRLSVELFVTKSIFKSILLDVKLTGERKNKIKTTVSSDARQLAIVFSEASRTVVPSVIFTLVSTPIVIYQSGISGLITIIFIFTLIPIALFSKKKIAQYQNEVKNKEDAYNNSLEHWFRNFLQIKYEKREPQVVEGLVAAYDKFVQVSNKSHILFLAIFGLTNLWWLFSLTCLVIMTKLFNQKMEISAFFSILWILSLMVRYFTGIPTFITSASNAKVVLSRIYSFIQRGLVSNDAEVSDLKVLNISLRNVSYSVEKRNIFKNLNIDIPLNGIIYVKGGPGSGKSLLLNILMGNIVPDSGEILLHLSDGSKVAVRASSENIMRKATFLADSPFLFRGTVKQNVLVDFDNSLRDEKVSYILKAVELEDELSEDFLIAEGGKNLSGGQKQRIVLARAILKKSEFFIFDNPFSALDEITIEKISSQFKKLDKPIILTSTRKDFSRYSQVINLDELINE